VYFLYACCVKIITEAPFAEFDGYEVFHTRMGRGQVCLRNPKTGARKTLLRSKYRMSVHIGRILEAHEQVDHVDGNRGNDDLYNLEIVSRLENLRRYASGLSRTLVTLVCPYCEKPFTREKRQTHLGKGKPDGQTHCSRACARRKR
jgi:hypothetical protein